MQHPILGLISTKVSQKARRFTFRPTSTGLKVTMPLGATERELTESIESILPKLIAMRERFLSKNKDTIIDTHFTIEAEHFCVSINLGDTQRPTARFSNGRLNIVCPTATDFNNKALQDWFIMIIEEALRHQSRRVLIPRLQLLAQTNGFRFNKVSIHKTHGRWGSCSTQGNINISLYLLLLPKRLQDYVILHELCHTIEMNHSPRFWALLDKVSGVNSQSMRREIKLYDTSIFTTCKKD